MKKSLPNIFSIIRALIAPVFFLLLKTDTPLLVEMGCILFLIGAVTDYLDGWWARKYGAITNWGIFFDPLADKILTLSAFVLFVTMEILPFWMVFIIIVRDIITTLFRVYADKRKQPIKTSYSAKIKTFLQMTFIAFILILIFIKNLNVTGIVPQEYDSIIYSSTIYYSMLVLTMFTLWTVVEYIYQNKSLISQIWCESQ